MNKFKVKQIAYAGAALITIYVGIMLAQPDRIRFYRLNMLWSAESASFKTLRDKSTEIKAETKNDDFAFCANYLATVATTFEAVGYENMPEVVRGGGLTAFLKGLITGFLDPIGGLINSGRIAVLLWNQTDFEVACNNLDARYPLVDWLLLLIAGIGAMVVYSITGRKAQIQNAELKRTPICQ